MGPSTPQRAKKSAPRLNKKNIPSQKRSSTKWEDILAAFEQELLRKRRAEQTIQAYRIQVEKFGQFYRDQLHKTGPYISRIHETDLYAFIDYLRNTCYRSVSTVNKAVSALHAFAQYLIEQRLHRRNIAQGLKTIYAGQTSEPTRLTAGEVRRMLAAIDLNRHNGYRDYAIVQLFLQCGLRLSELTRLSGADSTLLKTKGQLIVKDEKTRAERQVPLNASARHALRQYIHTRGGLRPEAPLFISARGQRISKQAVQYVVKKYLTAAGRPDLSVADLRQHFAVGLYAKKKSLPLVQKALGHRNIATTARYVSASQGELADALEEIPDNVYHDEMD